MKNQFAEDSEEKTSKKLRAASTLMNLTIQKVSVLIAITDSDVLRSRRGVSTARGRCTHVRSAKGVTSNYITARRNFLWNQSTNAPTDYKISFHLL